MVQVIASLAASLTLQLIFGRAREHFFGTVPMGSAVQSLVLEFITSFYLMFVICGVATDNRAVSSTHPSLNLYDHVPLRLPQGKPCRHYYYFVHYRLAV
jgi:glycerol uptake facilitator-like aquaporin